MLEELAWLEKLRPKTWQRLATVAGSDVCPRTLRSEIVLGGQAAYAFIANRILKVARGFPWCLARGNVEQKLSDLASLRAPPPDELATKVYQLMHRGASVV